MLLQRLLDLERLPAAARPADTAAYDLDRFRHWLAGLGSPQDGQRFLHIAGTKGKGSTAAIAEGLLHGIGFPTALYSSPHLEHYGERFRINGVPWTLEEFGQRLEAFYESLSPELRLGFDAATPFRTVFETLTALALTEFRRRDLPTDRSPAMPRIVVWETGLGGRLDCTNVVDPRVSVITALGLDHQKFLGNTLTEIAREKAGIIKPGRPVVVSRQTDEAMEQGWPEILARASRVGAPVVRAWEHNPVRPIRMVPEGMEVEIRLPDGTPMEALLPLRGEYQAGNLEAALAAVWIIAREEGLTPTPDAIQRGLAMVSWPGRFEIHPSRSGRFLVLDGAHCPLSAAAFGRELRRFLATLPDPRFLLLFGMQGDKDHQGFLRAFLSTAGPDHLQGILTHGLGGGRSATPEALADAARDLGLPAIACASPDEALGQAADSGCQVVATGSLYLLAHFRSLWSEQTRPTEKP